MYVSTVETTHFLLFIIDSFARNKETFFSLSLLYTRVNAIEYAVVNEKIPWTIM